MKDLPAFKARLDNLPSDMQVFKVHVVRVHETGKNLSINEMSDIYV